MRVVPVSSQVTMKTTSISPPAKAAAPIEYVDEVLEFRPLLRRVIWLMILLLVAFNAALLGILAYCYLQNETNDSLLWLFRIYFLYSNGNAFLMQNSQRVALGYAILCGVFALVGIRLIWISYSKGRSRIKEISGGPPSRRAHFVLVQNAISLSTSIIRRLKHWYGQWHRAIGVRGPYFDIRLLVEEVFEIGGQTIAAVSASESISSVPLNVVYAAVIFLNSVSAFTFRRLFKGSLIKERHACLLTDLVLDFVWGSLLPIWMYVPIVRIYLNRSHVLDCIATFTNSTREIERVLIISWKLYVLSVVPFVNSLVNFLELQTILREISQGATCLQIRYPVAQRPHNRFVRFAHALLPLYGVAVLIVSLVANGAFGSSPQQSEVVCLHRVYPWFSTKEACLGRQINCTLLGIEGASAEIRSILDEFDRSSLADLFLFSCPALEMPSTLQKFNQLMSIVVKESTLVQWSEAALIDNNVFRELRTVQLWSVGFVYDPVGLTGSKPIAASVEWIHLENLDGTRLLSLVGDHWKGLLYFDCMTCGLDAIPEAVYRMPRLTMLSLALNNIDSVSENWVPRSHVQLQTIWFDYNLLLSELPDSLWKQAATCGIFSMSWTNLSVVPDWLAGIAGPDFMLTAIDTPVCTGKAKLAPEVSKLVICEQYLTR